MSYHRVRPLGAPPIPNWSPTFAFAQSVDPYLWRASPPGAIFEPYGWHGAMNVGMPMRYSRHIDYVRSPAGVSMVPHRGGGLGSLAAAGILAVL